jgi:hypothetical protein
MALDTVNDYIVSARRLLLDEVEPYRYPTADLVEAFNFAFLEARRLRPDLFLANFRGQLPSYSPSNLTASVSIDPQYRLAFLYFMCGFAQLRDDEATQDQRASGFMAKFIAQLQTISA